MKVTSLLIAVVALSSCVAKPWFVGSVNDHYTMHAYEAGEEIDIPAVGQPVHRNILGLRVHKKHSRKDELVPVGHNGSNPLH